MNALGIPAGRFIGKRMPRKEDPRLLTGRGQFVDDIALPGMLHCAFARTPIARGKILSIDTSAAREVPGVHMVYTAEDFADQTVRMRGFFVEQEVPVRTPPLCEGRIAHVGEPFAMVIADTRHIAEDACSLIELEYEEEDPVITMAQARTGAPVHPSMADNMAGMTGVNEIGAELQAKLDKSAFVIEEHVVHQRIVQSPMETRGIVATRDGPEEFTLYITCQSPHLIARWVTLTLDIPDMSIKVIAKDVGGSFGLKNNPWREETAVMIAALKFGRPLKWIEDRYEYFIGANQAREQEMTLKLGFDAQGYMTCGHGDYDNNNGAFPHGPGDNFAVHMFMWLAYKMPDYGFVTRGCYTNTPGQAAYRGPWAMESLIREAALDRAARKLGIEPYEIRRRNLITAADQPATTGMGMTVDDITPHECMEMLLEKFDVAAFRKEQAAARKEGRYLGLGIAAYIEPTAVSGIMSSMTGEFAQVRIDPTGRVTASLSTHSQGHGTTTTMAQVIADRIGVRYEDVTVFEGDSSTGAFGPGAAGSRQGVIAGGAAYTASDMLVEKVKAIAAHMLNANAESITIDDGVIHVAGAPEMSMPLRELAEIAHGHPARLPEGMVSGLEAQYRYQGLPMVMTSAAHLCVVEVSAETGFVEIKRWMSAEDCGTVINPAVVEGQIAGGLVQGIGTVLLEEMAFDARGNPTVATYKDYLLPSISDVPEFEFHHRNTPSKSTGGMRGVGEGGAIIGPPTLCNAIIDALAPFGELEIDLPLSPVKLLGFIEGRDLSGAH